MRLNKIFTKSSEILSFHTAQEHAGMESSCCSPLIIAKTEWGLQKMQIMLQKQCQETELEMSICFLLNTH